MAAFDRACSGFPAMDRALDNIRMGDNVVWQVSSLEQYRIFARAFADQAIAAGEIDGIGVARQFLADPEWLNKARFGSEQDIRPCIACHNGCFGVSLGNPPRR